MVHSKEENETESFEVWSIKFQRSVCKFTNQLNGNCDGALQNQAFIRLCYISIYLYKSMQSLPKLPRKINGGDQEFFDYILSLACDAENQKDERNFIK